jgi:CBS domain-containing protein
MKLADILDAKGWGSVTADESVDVATVVRIMCDNHVGAAIILGHNGGIAGIVTERDILRQFSERGALLAELDVRSVMSRKVETATPDTPTQEALQRMTANRFRHLPVVEDEKLLGVVSIGDLVKSMLREKEQESEALREYITH